MHSGDDESPDSQESGYGGNPSLGYGGYPTQPSGYGGYPSQLSGYGGSLSQPWSWSQTPRRGHRVQTLIHFSHGGQDALDTMMGLLSSGIPNTPVARVETLVPTRRSGGRGGGGGRSGGRGGGGSGSAGGSSGSGVGSGGGEGSGVSSGRGSGNKRGKLYTKAESIAVVRAWDATHRTP
ncbi:glycine-rich cell wall structural protein 1.0-like [Salvia splendens]|uniref:glycine-rich cell wall structural protein 1.0-like n=1 Tax=Salvia splendens TaxID=180675 RepID=UPI001C26990D|nr:glycine-rich cell wall structural protein 1.0-like [Salvia splendens]